MIKAIDRSTIHKICSGQVIVDLSTAVKEMIENSLDSGATVIEVKLCNSGIDSIEVSDNGTGIDPSNYNGVAIKHSTSKLKVFDDVFNVSTFGFRGEALNSLCEISGEMSLTTKREGQSIGAQLLFDKHGKVSSQKVVARSVGTSVLVKRLFDKLPVRRAELERQVKKQYLKMLKVVQCYALISVGVKIVVTDKPVASNTAMSGKTHTVLATQNGTKTMLDTCSILFGASFASSLVPVSFTIRFNGSEQQHTSTTCKDKSISMDDSSSGELSGSVVFDSISQLEPPIVTPPNNGNDYVITAEEEKKEEVISLTGYISKAGVGVGRSDNERQFLFCNGRPVDNLKFNRVMNEVWRKYEMSHKPAFIIDLRMPGGMYDVNVTPDKREIVLAHEAQILDRLHNAVDEIYAPSRFTFQVKQNNEVTRTSSISAPHKASVVSQVTPQGHETSTNTSMHTNDSIDSSNSGHGYTVTFESPFTNNSYRSAPPCNGIVTASTSGSNGTILFASSNRVKQSIDNQSRLHNISPRNNEECLSVNSFEEKWCSLASNGSPSLSSSSQALTSDKHGETSSSDHSFSFLASASVWSSQQANQQQQLSAQKRSPSSEWIEEDRVPKTALRKDERDNNGVTLSIASVTPLSLNNHASAERTSPSALFDRFVVHTSNSPAALTRNTFDLTAVEVPTQHRDQNKSGVEFIPQPLHAPQTLTIDIKDILNRDIGAECDDYEQQRARVVQEYRAKMNAKSGESIISSGASSTVSDSTDSRILCKNDFMRMRVIGQFNLGFIVCELDGDLFVLDQHACDEKFRFETLQRTTKIHQQPLLVPLSLETSVAMEMVIRENMHIFEANGFRLHVNSEDNEGGKEQSIECDSQNSEATSNPNVTKSKKSKGRVTLLSVPFSKGVQFGPEDVNELASMIGDSVYGTDSFSSATNNDATDCRGLSGNKNYLMLKNDGTGGFMNKFRLPKLVATFASRACRSSVMVGTALNEQEMRGIVQRMEGLDQPWNCPHGRPTMRHLFDMKQL